jgi:DNA-binding NarL/FixJ family response regulator
VLDTAGTECLFRTALCVNRGHARDWQPELRGSPDASKPLACDDLGVRPTVVIVDDHSGFRLWVRALLEAEGFDVVGEAEDGVSALAVVDLLHPRVVLLDVALPDMDGFEIAERLAQTHDPPAVVLISTRDVSSYRRRLARSPARGFVSKSELSGNAISTLVS